MKRKNPTRDKVKEAEYFLSKMRETFEDDDIFSYNLSAFLSAARSITWYMKKQYRHREGFNEWYCQKQIEMKTDRELKYLNEARVENVHKTPVPTGSTRQGAIRIDAIVAKEGVSEAKQPKKGEYKSPEQRNQRTVRRFFPKFKDIDVIEFCEKQLKKLADIVQECESNFGNYKGMI